jgi:hypothetical protein
LEVILEVIGSADRLPDIDRANMEYYATFQFIFVSKKYKNNKGNDASTGKVRHLTTLGFGEYVVIFSNMSTF